MMETLELKKFYRINAIVEIAIDHSVIDCNSFEKAELEAEKLLKEMKCQ